ncbi:MAG: hypothetical protein KGL39_48870 [Patescibacteria group bacterium]|nr:hypothetical protein [Patescibacteria group bacterium]
MTYQELEDAMIAELASLMGRDVPHRVQNFLRAHVRKIAEAAAASGVVEELEGKDIITIGSEFANPRDYRRAGSNAARSQSLAQVEAFFNREQK